MTEIQTTEVHALVTLTVAPREGQSLSEAHAEMLQLFQDYVTDEHNFMDDYGATIEQIASFREDPDATEPSWGGYEGPFVIAAEVRDAAEPVSEGAEWHRQVGDRYAKIALESDNLAVKVANSAEATKYYGIADRLRSVTSRSK